MLKGAVFRKFFFNLQIIPPLIKPLLDSKYFFLPALKDYFAKQNAYH